MNLDTWTHIPVSFSVKEKTKSQANRKKIVVDAVISTAVFLQAARDLQVKSQVLGHVIMRLERKLKVQLTYKSGRFSWAKKEYVGGTCPTTHPLEPQASPRDYAKFMDGEDYTVVQKKSEQINSEVVLTPPPATAETPAPTKSPTAPLIQEIQQYSVKSPPPGKTQPPIQVFEERYLPHREQFTVQVDLSQCTAPNEAALDASVRTLRLTAPPNFLLHLDFLVPVYGDSARARLQKRAKRLLISVPKA